MLMSGMRLLCKFESEVCKRFSANICLGKLVLLIMESLG